MEEICRNTMPVCPKCGGPLLESDIPDYDYLCPECDENFYECEV